MKATQSLAGLTLAASLFLAPAVPTVQAQQFAGKPSTLPPSVPGGAPITVAVYNYTSTPMTAYWVTPAGVLQPVPGVAPFPPITGVTPVNMQSFRNATLVFKGPAKGVGQQGRGKHFGGNNPAPFIVLGNPPPGVNPPGNRAGKGSAPAGTTPAATTTPTATVPAATTAPGKPGTTVNKSVVNKNVTNNPPAEAPESGEDGGGKGRKKVVNKGGDVSITVNPTPSDTPAPAPASSPDSPPAPMPPSAADTPSEEPDVTIDPLPADDPRVVEFLRIHNAARSDVGVSPLEWSDDLAFTAQDWANRIASSGKIEHRLGSEYGENIGWGTGDFTSASAANLWLAEKSKYSPDAPAKPAGKKKKQSAASEHGAETAHYTQMVWGKSTMVGVGIAMTKDGRTVVVANYNPRGNIEGERPYGP